MFKNKEGSFFSSAAFWTFLPMLIALGGSLFVGMSPIFVKASKLPPITIGFYRLLFAIPFLFLWSFFENRNKETKRYSVSTHLKLAASGLLFALDLALWNESLQLTSVVNSTILNNFSVFFIPLFLWVIYSKRPNLWITMGSLMAIGGSALLVGEKMSISFSSLMGDFIAVLSAFAWGAYFITVEKLRKELSPGTILFWSGVYCALSLAFIALLREQPFFPLDLQDAGLMVGYALLVQVGGQGLVAVALGSISSSFLALVMLLGPVLSGWVAWVLFNESMSMQQIIGAAIILMSIAVAKLGDKDKKTPDPQLVAEPVPQEK